MKKKLIIKNLDEILNSCQMIDKDLFKDGEVGKEQFLKFFFNSWIKSPIEEIRKEVLK